jgi:ribonucleotide reductase alpha subunit
VRITDGGILGNDLLTARNAANTAQLPHGSVDLRHRDYVTATRDFGAGGTPSQMVQNGNRRVPMPGARAQVTPALEPELAAEVKRVDGDLSQVPAVPGDVRDRFRTAFQLDPHALIAAAARRQKWIDQSQSLNLFLAAPDLKAMSHMYRAAWHAGLKTTYYLRTLGASAIEKATVSAAAPVPAAACSIEAARNGEECEVCQ